MASTSDQQVPRLFMFIHKVCLPVVRTYFENVILCDPKYNNNYKTFLEHHKHEIYHLFVHERCCKCKAGKVIFSNKHRLVKTQFDKVYTFGRSDRSHLSYENGAICKHCCCGLVSNENCSTEELDMTALHAILKTCVPNLDVGHAMWLDKLVEERHKICHMSVMMSEDEAQGIWSYLESSTLALALTIPPIPLYGKTIKTQVELLKDGNYSFDTVGPAIDAIRLEIAEQNNYVKETVQQTTASLQETINVQVGKASSEMIEIVEKQSIKLVESMEKTKCDIVSAVEELKGQFTHENESCIYDVKWLAEETTFDGNKGEIYVNFNIPSAGFTEAQTKDIKDSMRKAAESISLWKPYRIILVYEGSIVIGTLLPVDVFEEKATFEDSIRRFLDRFTSTAGWNNQSKMQLKVNVAVCQSAVPSSDHTQEFKRSFTTNEPVQAIPQMSDKMVDANQDVHETASSSFHKREYEKSFTKNESVQAVPLMSDKMVDTNPDIMGTDDLRYHMISRNQSSFPSEYPYSKEYVVICWRNIDNFVVEKIKLFMENDESVRSCFTIKTLDVGEIIETYIYKLKKIIYVSTDGYYDPLVLLWTHLDKDKQVEIVIDVSRFTQYVTYESSVMEQILEELTNALGPSCYDAFYCTGRYGVYSTVVSKKWTVLFSSSLSTNSKVISIIDMLSNFLKSKHTKPYVTLRETRDVRPDVPYILPISHAKCDITRNVKPENIISMQLDSTTLPTSMSNVDSVDARNLQDGKWLQQLEQILSTQYWITCLENEPGYNTVYCGEYSDFALVCKKIDALLRLSSTLSLKMFDQGYLIAFLFKKTEQETSSALIRYINECDKETIIVLCDHAEIPDQLRDYHTIHAFEDNVTTYIEILKAMEGRRESIRRFKKGDTFSNPHAYRIPLTVNPRTLPPIVDMDDTTLVDKRTTLKEDVATGTMIRRQSSELHYPDYSDDSYLKPKTDVERTKHIMVDRKRAETEPVKKKDIDSVKRIGHASEWCCLM